MMTSFEQDALGGRERTVLDLTDRWEALVEEQREGSFDRDAFCRLAADTFRLFFPLRDKHTLYTKKVCPADDLRLFFPKSDETRRETNDIPRDVLPILLFAKEFASCKTFLSCECGAAELVADALCSQLANGWIAIDGVFSEERFVVEGFAGFYIIDTATFDLSQLIEDVEDALAQEP